MIIAPALNSERAIANEADPFEGMNKTEKAYAERLEALRKQGEIREWRYQDVTLAIAKDCRYTPDFFVVLADRTIRFDEVKGFWRDDALVKIKVAAASFPWFAFQSVSLKPKKDGGGWKVRKF